MRKFYALIATQCQSSKNPNEFYSIISLRIRQYFEAQRIDMDKTAKGFASMELPSSFVSFLVNANEEPPYELMSGVTIRLQLGVESVSKVFDELMNPRSN